MSRTSRRSSRTRTSRGPPHPHPNPNPLPLGWERARLRIAARPALHYRCATRTRRRGLGAEMKCTTRFRLLIEAPEIVVLPGVHDALTLRIAEQAGFQAVTCGGYSATASLLGAPDVQQLTMTEMADMYARLCDATELPLFADGDTGYGNTSNVARTVRAYERAGVAGLFIEDQESPKRCGHMEGKRVIPAADMVAKLKAALDARVDADLIICARTDSRAVHGLDDA